MTVRETFNNNGVLIERITYGSKAKSVAQIIALAMLLLSIFATVALKSIMQHYDAEFPVWFWVVDAIAPLASCAMFAIYEMLR